MTPPPAKRCARSRPLTADEQRLVAEFDPYVFGVVHRVPPHIRQHLGGDDAVASDVRLQVVLAAISFDPSMGSAGDIAFGAFAHISLARWLGGYIADASRRRRVWEQTPEWEDGDMLSVIPDHRDADDPVLRAWHDPDYTELRRRHLDWRTRVLLCLRTVEGMGVEDAAAAMGMDAREARRVEWLAGVNLAYLRGGNPQLPRLPDGARRCRKCNYPAVPGITLCSACREYRRLMNKARYEARKAAGLCADSGCSSPPAPGRPYCHEHHEHKLRVLRIGKARKRAAARVEAATAAGCP